MENKELKKSLSEAEVAEFEENDDFTKEVLRLVNALKPDQLRKALAEKDKNTHYEPDKIYYREGRHDLLANPKVKAIH